MKLFSVIYGTFVERVLPPQCRDAVSVFYSPSRLGQKRMDKEHNIMSSFTYQVGTGSSRIFASFLAFRILERLSPQTQATRRESQSGNTMCFIGVHNTPTTLLPPHVDVITIEMSDRVSCFSVRGARSSTKSKDKILNFDNSLQVLAF